MFCPRCGTDAHGARFCPNCGTQLASAQQQVPEPGYPAPPPAPRSSGSKVALVLAGLVAGVLVVALIAIGGVLLLRSNGAGDDSGAATSTAGAVSPPATAPTTSAAPPPKAAKPKPRTPRATGPGDVRGLPAGLFCRDLMSRGYSYVAAVDYWRMHGQPNQMDADRNGIPCETVYAPTDVSSYWSVRNLPPALAVPVAPPSGLFCRDLYARGVSYADAVSYWWSEGAPDRMDADLNGIPCETVYPTDAVDAYW